MCSGALVCLLRYLNKQKEAELQRYVSLGEPHLDLERSLEEAGDEHLKFHYIL